MIEPGSIATEIWEKGTNEAQAQLDGMSPRARELYGKRLQSVLKLADRAGRTAIPPDRVAKKIEHALTASRPKTRYLVGPDAHVQMALQRVLTDKGLDRVLGALTPG